MNNLELIDPASPERMEFYHLMGEASLGFFMLTLTLLLVTIGCLGTFADKKFIRSFRSLRFNIALAVGIILIGASVGATIMSSNQGNIIREERKVNIAKNAVTVQEWAEDVYGINLTEQQATGLMKAERSTIYATPPSEYEDSEEITELGKSLIRDADNKVTEAQLVYDSERYLILRDNSRELERR